MAESPHHPEFRVHISELDNAGKEYHFPVRASWVRGVLEDSEASAAGDDGQLDVRLSRSGKDVVVLGRLRAELTAPCGRCLEPARVSIDEKLSLLMVPTAKSKHPDEAEYEFSSDEADVAPYDGENVILDEVVRDELVLQIPMIPLCSEDCPGMSAPGISGAAHEASQEPLDPRLLPLLRLKNLKKE